MGWVQDFYILPQFHFKYQGFEWVHSLGIYTYLLFGIAILASIGVILGYKYRLSMLVFFLSFTYIELIDKTTYLNHYYFLSLLSFVLIFLPLDARYSWASYTRGFEYQKVPRWTVDVIRVFLSMVYFYAGLAKLNSDWLLRTQPLKTWLSAKQHLPIVGRYMDESWVHYLMSWSGAIYDLAIPFLLWNKRTRPIAFLLVVVFHISTRCLFNIGMFPFIMIGASLIFLSPEVVEHVTSKVSKYSYELPKKARLEYSAKYSKIAAVAFSIFFIVQALLPFRSHLYPGQLFWTEEGFRFSWRVMLIEKTGYTNFILVDGNTGKKLLVDNRDFLNEFQIKQMSFQPDFILEYAKYLGAYYKKKGIKEPKIYAESYVALNGRRSQVFVDPSIDLYAVSSSQTVNNWILPLNDTIKGL